MKNRRRRSGIYHVVRSELRQRVSRPVKAMADELRRRHDPDGILFYGSCLRRNSAEGVMDFYLLVESYRAFHEQLIPAVLNALLPPNVYYLEVRHNNQILRAKYAILSFDDLVHGTSARAFEAYFWGRFAQPCALAYVRDAKSRDVVADSVSAAVEQIIRKTLPLMASRFTSRELWLCAFCESYRTELRAEGPARPHDLYEDDAERYDDAARSIILSGDLAQLKSSLSGGVVYHRHSSSSRRMIAGGRWFARRLVGRLLHVLRLAKAAYTFRGGLDYALWKIARHTGKRIHPTTWQRRHPILAAAYLIWKLNRGNAGRQRGAH